MNTTHPRLLSGLYSRSRSAKPPTGTEDCPEILSLHRKYRIQRDRLIAWGLEWNDGEKQQVNIDDSVERAGLTEVVSSVMENINLILDEVDNIRLEPVSGPYPVEKMMKRRKIGPWTREEREQYQDLLEDLTASLNLLCDLRAQKQPSPKAMKAEEDAQNAGQKLSGSPQPARKMNQIPPSTRHGMKPSTLADGKIPLIHYSALKIPEESPPSYDETGTPRPSRHFAKLYPPPHATRSGESMSIVSVLIEYIHVGFVCQGRDVLLPIDHLQQLFACLSRIQETNSVLALPVLVGYFEDPYHLRYGLVFELSPPAQKVLAATEKAHYTTMPITLLDMLQTVSHLQEGPLNSVNLFIPPLEERFRLAYQLVSTVSALDQHGFIHQALNSHSIVLLPRMSGRARSITSFDRLRSLHPLLTGFDLFSQSLNEQTPPLISQTIYRHPMDPGPTSAAASQHSRIIYNLYSLGLILLEIGLWIPLGDIFKEKYTLQDFRTRVEKIWIPRLAGKCGTAYMKAVQGCLDIDKHTGRSPEMVPEILTRIQQRLARCCLLAEPEEEDIDDLHMTNARNAIRIQRPQSDIDSKTSILSPPSPITAEPLTTSKSKRKLASNQAGPKPPQIFADVHIPTEIVKHWENILMYRVGKIVDKELNKLPGKPATSSVSLDMCGVSRDVARPTILVCVSRDWDVIETQLRQRLRSKWHAFDIAVFSGPIVRAKVHRAVGECRRQAQNPFYQERPVCGASIGALVDGEHSPPVTFGGLVIVDDQLYGLTVHHVLESPESESDEDEDDDAEADATVEAAEQIGTEPLGNVEASVEEGEEEEEEEEEENEDASLTPTISRSSRLSVSYRNVLAALKERDEESPSAALSGSTSTEANSDTLSAGSETEDDDNDEATDHAGDTVGIAPNGSLCITVTQPALLDVAPNFFPVPDDKDEDHLDSHTLGHVYASSGLRRVDHTHNSVPAKVEIDWALIKVNPSRLQSANVIVGGKSHCSDSPDVAYQPRLIDPVSRNNQKDSEDTYPRFIAPSAALTGLSVHSIGRTTGLTNGIIRSLGFVRFPHRQTCSRIWVVRGGMGVPGDSGAWVIDNASGKVCGHILAWSEMAGAAFLAPMDVTLDDVKKTLGAKSVRLPGALPWEGVQGLSSLSSTLLEAGSGSARACASAVDSDTLRSALEDVEIESRPPLSKHLSPNGTGPARGGYVQRRIADVDASTRSCLGDAPVGSGMGSRATIIDVRKFERAGLGERLTRVRVADCFN